MTLPADLLRAGVAILAPALEAHGFAYFEATHGKASGGLFASGEFKRGDRNLELHFRYSLGLVAYHVGAKTLTHEEYMWSMIGRKHASRYPGFPENPLGGFRNLRLDIEEYGADFLAGSDADFLRHFERIRFLRAAAPHIP